MQAQIVGLGYYKRVINCLCPDGVRRTVRLTNEPDTFFSIPARVQAYGKTITGFVTSRESAEYEGRDYEFIPYTYCKNHEVFTQKGK